MPVTFATAIVVGTIIGTGIFLKPAILAQNAGSFQAVMLAWICAGALSFAGALTYAELGARIPQVGGEYAYLKHAYGRLPAFLFGWMRFWIASPGSVAAYGVGAATFLNSIFPLPIKVVSVCFILVFTCINCLTVFVGAGLQTFLTVLKVLAIAGIVVVLFVFVPSSQLTAAGFDPANFLFNFQWNGPGAFGAAVLAALWAYDGWNNLSMVGAEIKDPQKNIPRALLYGMGIVLFLYLAVNVAYFHALSFSEIATSNSSQFQHALPVAALALFKVVGERGVLALSIIFVISALGAMNGSILTGARVPYAMARDGLFFKFLAGVKNKTPIASVLTQGLWACMLALSGTFDQLTDSVVFASWIFYALTASALFKIRKENGAGSPSGSTSTSTSTFKTPGYPFVPAIFIALSIVLLANTIITSFNLTLLGLFVIALGIPFYLFKKRTFSI